MQFRDLRTQYDKHKVSIDSAISRVLESTGFIGGAEVNELERELSDYVGTRNCVSCANGTDALQLALMAWDVGNGDAVFVPDFTFFSSGEVVSAVGAPPVFVDVEEDTFNICPDSLQRQIEWVINNTDLDLKAIVAVDLFGYPANHAEIRKIADKYNMYVLEDGAQGFGGSIGNKKACSFGDISTTSFFPAKPLGCYGDGGAIFTDNDEWAEIIRSFKVHGKGSDKYDNIRIGMNSRLDTIQAAILLEKLKFFDEEIVQCNRVADMYTKYMSQNERIVLPTIKQGYMSSWAQYTILLEYGELRSDVMNRLKEKDIPSMIYYKKPMHMQKAFEGLNVGKDDYDSTTSICQRCLSLPMSAYIDEEEVVKISEIIKDMK